MFEMYQNISEVGPVAVLLFGLLGGYRAGQLVYRASRKKLRRSTLTTLILTGLAVLFFLVVTGMAAGMISYGWVFASNRFVVALPPMFLAVVATVVFAVPRLIRLRRNAKGDPDDAPSAELRYASADPWLVVPVQVLGISGLVALYTLFVARPVPPYTVDVLVVNGILAAASALLVLRQLRRQRALGGEKARPAPRFWLRSLRAAGGLAVIAAVVVLTMVIETNVSQLPGSFDMGASDNMDFGGGSGMDGVAMAGMDMGGAQSHAASVTDLTGGDDIKGKPDAEFTLTAQQTRITLGSGRIVDAWTYNGQIPGPELRVHDGDLVQVTLINTIPNVGVTLHWHGVDVPNAEDGVPGVTQDAVKTGQSFTYRFRVHQVGTFWYHSHQEAYGQVDRGLFGPLVILPKGAQPQPYDMTVTVHDWKLLKADPNSRTEAHLTFGKDDVPSTRAVPAGSQVRLRVINAEAAAVSDEATPTFSLNGTQFKVAAIEGTDVHEPGDLADGTTVRIGTGGRADLTFTMPDHPVRLTDLEQPSNSFVLSPNGQSNAPTPRADAPLFDPAHYGTPASTPFTAASHFDRNFNLILDDGPGFYDGHFEFRLTINGKVFPDTPMLMVKENDLVKVTLVGRGHTNHPFHLHGHHVLVLSHNGQPSTGSPWWTDTLEVRVGDVYQIAFRADNPGIWMDHCHNLQHASKGMVMHLGYIGVTTPFRAGRDTGNTPESQ